MCKIFSQAKMCSAGLCVCVVAVDESVHFTCVPCSLRQQTLEIEGARVSVFQHNLPKGNVALTAPMYAGFERHEARPGKEILNGNICTYCRHRRHAVRSRNSAGQADARRTSTGKLHEQVNLLCFSFLNSITTTAPTSRRIHMLSSWKVRVSPH